MDFSPQMFLATPGAQQPQAQNTPPSFVQTAQPRNTAPLFNPNNIRVTPSATAAPGGNGIVFVDINNMDDVRSAFNAKEWKRFPRTPSSLPWDKIPVGAHRFLRALGAQESGMMQYDVGDQGLEHHAYGPFQIRMPTLVEVNELTGRVPRVFHHLIKRGKNETPEQARARQQQDARNKAQWLADRYRRVRETPGAINEFTVFTDPNASWEVAEAILRRHGWKGEEIRPNTRVYNEFIKSWNSRPSYRTSFDKKFEAAK